MSKLYPFDTLQKAELKVLYQLFSIKEDKKAKEVLTNKLSKILLPGKGLLQSGLSYTQFIEKIAAKQNIELPKKGSFYEKESTLFVKLFAKNFNDLSKEEKEHLMKALREQGLTKEQVASVTALATIGAAQLSGFGIYLLASSTVGALSSVVGVTLPFALYTGMSKLISIAIGPVGFLLAAYPIYKSYKGVVSMNDFVVRSKEHYLNLRREGSTLLKGNYELGETVFNYLAGLRIMKVQQAEEEIESLKEKKKVFSTTVENKVHQKARLQEEIDEINKTISQLNRDINHNNRSNSDITQQIKDCENQLFSLKYPGVKRVDINNMESIPYRD